jgi:hypothetical protein
VATGRLLEAANNQPIPGTNLATYKARRILQLATPPAPVDAAGDWPLAGGFSKIQRPPSPSGCSGRLATCWQTQNVFCSRRPTPPSAGGCSGRLATCWRTQNVFCSQRPPQRRWMQWATGHLLADPECILQPATPPAPVDAVGDWPLAGGMFPF